VLAGFAFSSYQWFLSFDFSPNGRLRFLLAFISDIH